MLKAIITSFVLFTGMALFFVVPKSFADTTNGGYGGVVCQPTYGGGNQCQSANISVNKTVVNPKTGQFVDNLTVNDPRFQPEATVQFQIVVTNTGATTLTNVTVKDTLPQYITPINVANYDSNSRSFSVTIGNLDPGQSQTFTFQAKIDPLARMPLNTAITCMTNSVTATGTMIDTNQMVSSQDTAGFCVEKTVQTKGGLTVFPAPQVDQSPSTGPEALPLALVSISGMLGYFIQKKSRLHLPKAFGGQTR